MSPGRDRRGRAGTGPGRAPGGRSGGTVDDGDIASRVGGCLRSLLLLVVLAVLGLCAVAVSRGHR